jgi:hypothetical protein
VGQTLLLGHCIERLGVITPAPIRFTPA